VIVTGPMEQKGQSRWSPAAQSVIDAIEQAGPLPITRGFQISGALEQLRNPEASDLFPRGAHPRAAMAGLWLAAGDWDKAHELADHPGPEGAYWHGIVHRIEPDAGNSKYWFRQVGVHAIHGPLAQYASEIDRRHGSVLNLKASWDPALFVDACERLRGAPDEIAAREVQQAEWRLLLEYCARSIAS
jgi:hypothetical protein